MSKTIKINGECVRAFRTKRGLSQKELAGRVKVDAGTVSRWERGEIDHVRRDIFGKLCQVLDATEAQIRGDEPLPESSAAQQALKGQMNLSIDRACRNALSLVAMRYGVTRQRIVEVAPLLFCIAAEQSLQQRRKCLADLRSAAEAVYDAAPSHLPRYWPVDEGVLKAEQRSIESRDLFGSIVVDAETLGVWDSEWDEETDNPFAAFLSAALAGIFESAEAVRWPPYSEPSYAICEEEVTALVGDDADAVSAILGGYAALHEMPVEVRKSTPAERAKWASTQVPQLSPNIDDLI